MRRFMIAHLPLKVDRNVYVQQHEGIFRPITEPHFIPALLPKRHVKTKAAASMAPAFAPGKPPSYSKLGNEPDDHADDDYVAEHQRAQQIERQKQDESLDELHSAVKRLGDMSLNISTELDTQNKMLDDLNDDTDKAKQALEIVTKQTQELIKQSGGMKNFIVIIVLVLILLLLTYLVIMT